MMSMEASPGAWLLCIHLHCLPGPAVRYRPDRLARAQAIAWTAASWRAVLLPPWWLPGGLGDRKVGLCSRWRILWDGCSTSVRLRVCRRF